MKRKLVITPILSIAAATGCTPHIEEKVPTLPLSDEWKTDTTQLAFQNQHPSVAMESEDSRIIFHWWELYGDETLNTLEKEALGSNPTLQAALSRFEEALWTLGVHESDLYPTLSLSSQASRQRTAKDLRTSQQAISFPDASEPQPQPRVKTIRGPKHVNNLGASLVVQYEADLWGRLRLNQQSYKALAQASLEDVQAAQVLLTYQVAQLYYTIRYYEADLQIARDILECIKEQSQLHSTRYQSGINDLAPYLEMTAQEKRVEAEISNLQNEREKTIFALAALLGKTPQDFIMPEATSPWTYATPPLAIPAQVLLQRPDVKRSAHEVEALIARIGVAKTFYLPTLSLTALAGHESNKANTLFKWRNRIWSESASLGMTLLDAGARESEVRSAQAAFEAKASEHINTCLTAIQEVEEALSAYMATDTERKCFETQKAYSDTLFVLSQKRFNSGIASYQEVLAQRITKLSSMRTLLKSEFDLQQSSLQIIKAIGGSWDLASHSKEAETTESTATSKR